MYINCFHKSCYSCVPSPASVTTIFRRFSQKHFFSIFHYYAFLRHLNMIGQSSKPVAVIAMFCVLYVSTSSERDWSVIKTRRRHRGFFMRFMRFYVIWTWLVGRKNVAIIAKFFRLLCVSERDWSVVKITRLIFRVPTSSERIYVCVWWCFFVSFQVTRHCDPLKGKAHNYCLTLEKRQPSSAAAAAAVPKQANEYHRYDESRYRTSASKTVANRISFSHDTDHAISTFRSTH